MTVDTQTQAILLLTAHLGKSLPTAAKPLSPSEWGRFAAWLYAEGKRPKQFLESGAPETVLEGWSDSSIARDRILSLLGRSAALGVVLEKWERAGLWVITRSHPEYPTKLKKRLGQQSPPILIGCGNRGLLNAPGIAVVGSRDASENDLRFTWDFGRTIADGGHVVFSGGARGVDETAMLGCMEAGGKAVGILADSLLRVVTSTKYRNALATDQIVLATPYNPEAGFNVGNAMARNKYIYCCADAAVIVASGKSKGGTWSGALEAMRAAWVPVWVRTTPSSPEGNAALVRRGALDLGDKAASPEQLRAGQTAANSAVPASLFDGVAEKATATDTPLPPETATEQAEPHLPFPESVQQLSLFEVFILKLSLFATDAPRSSTDIAAALGMSKAQANAWLKEGLSNGLIEKAVKRPVRYCAVADAAVRILSSNSDGAVDEAPGAEGA